ncbi:DUF362 domain-containing protein [Tepidibacter formicigenes]|uniref:Ferredoxin n=1 Tax=Tepidibacter formicigenes DSM 15518 TaxID=1123349 RepID=A0A1M6N3D1_9FIRM|nr:DUF362 domain-containing protein [Tepidibacter formicigenes]SHJ90241.1 Uncharacterized conserved protein, DUF362 family [Tepidibacter formicigenes DSM 15518]
MKEVVIKKCENYLYENVKSSFKDLLKELGGLEKHIKPGSKVLIKMNLLMKKRPEEATTTHPILLKVLSEELLKLNCKVIVGDSPGGVYNERVLRAIYKTCGIEDIAKELDIELNYNTDEVRVENPKGKLVKYLTVIKPIEDVDHVISLCKLKTHVMATFTGGVKNLFGVIPGLLKAEYHFKMPDVRDFTDLLVDICEYVNPCLTIMDGIVGMEGEGPSAGNPRKVGVILGSSSPYALDVVACNIINLNPSNVPTIQRSVERKILEKDFSDIIVKGEKIENIIIKDYRIPNTQSIDFLEGRVPKFLQKYLNMFFKPKPIFMYKKCVGCGECERVCPPRAIDMKGNKPYVNLDKCIRCFCCHELCPKKAVDIKKPLFFKYFIGSCKIE